MNYHFFNRKGTALAYFLLFYLSGTTFGMKAEQACGSFTLANSSSLNVSHKVAEQYAVVPIGNTIVWKIFDCESTTQLCFDQSILEGWQEKCYSVGPELNFRFEDVPGGVELYHIQ